MEDEEDIPYISGSGEGLMEEGPSTHASARRNEDIALDLMKFVAMTTGYGRTTSSGVVGVVWEVPGGCGRQEVEIEPEKYTPAYPCLETKRAAAHGPRL
jgi:hypothetical protein